MSDFGAHVTIFRSDGRPPSADDEERVRVASRSLQFTQPDRIGPYDGWDLSFGLASADGIEGLMVGLTGYFIDDDERNDGLDPDVLIAREEPLAEQFAEDLARVLGTDYQCSSYSGYW
jgi:hypothetical protein